MVKKTKNIFIFILLTLLVGSVFSNFSDTESYLNGLDSSTSNDKDYDSDGSTESTEAVHIKFLKIPNLTFLPSAKIVLSLKIPDLDNEAPRVFIPEPIGFDYSLSIFRPPIAV